MYFIGDTHGLSAMKNTLNMSKIENQNLIHVGDFGLGFQEIHRDLADLDNLDTELGDVGNKLYVIRGNHDNPIFWNRRYGLNLPRYQNIILVDDYTVLKIENKNVLFMGGAISIDRAVRSAEHPPTWWIDEKFLFALGRIDAIAKKVDKIDIVVTHTAPGFAYPYIKSGFPKLVTQWIELDNQYFGEDLKYEMISEREQLTKIATRLEDHKLLPDYWFYGHFHNSHIEDHGKTKFVGLGVKELYKL